jgi:sugar porter (SP) family MFS transporter
MNKNKLLRYSIVAALAGFIFGFDTVVISGANEPIKKLWNTSPLFHGVLIMSMALWGTVLGAVIGGIPAEKYGRKKTLLWIGILFAVSAVGTALAPNPYIFSFFRFIGGLGIGVSSVVAPTYISEISTPATRGRLTALYQFNIVFGILVAYISNYLLQGVGGENDWRWMLGVLAIPSILYTIMVTSVPESPRWLISVKKDFSQAAQVLARIGAGSPEQEISNIIAADKAIEHGESGETIFDRKYNRVMWLAFFVAFFNQLSGINFILYYAPQILSSIGLGERESLANSIAIGGTNLIFTFVCYTSLTDSEERHF